MEDNPNIWTNSFSLRTDPSTCINSTTVIYSNHSWERALNPTFYKDLAILVAPLSYLPPSDLVMFLRLILDYFPIYIKVSHRCREHGGRIFRIWKEDSKEERKYVCKIFWEKNEKSSKVRQKLKASISVFCICLEH